MNTNSLGQVATVFLFDLPYQCGQALHRHFSDGVNSQLFCWGAKGREGRREGGRETQVESACVSECSREGEREIERETETE